MSYAYDLFCGHKCMCLFSAAYILSHKHICIIPLCICQLRFTLDSVPLACGHVPIPLVTMFIYFFLFFVPYWIAMGEISQKFETLLFLSIISASRVLDFNGHHSSMSTVSEINLMNTSSCLLGLS